MTAGKIINGVALTLVATVVLAWRYITGARMFGSSGEADTRRWSQGMHAGMRNLALILAIAFARSWVAAVCILAAVVVIAAAVIAALRLQVRSRRRYYTVREEVIRVKATTGTPRGRAGETQRHARAPGQPMEPRRPQVTAVGGERRWDQPKA